jgi:gamma-glutamyltranspeptidase/glutathione hydrolase
MVEDRDMAKMGFQSAAAVQLMVEAERRAYADRAEFMGDPDFVKVPVKQLTSDQYIKTRMQDYTPGKAGSSDITVPGTVPPESEETTHLSTIDKLGNAVSITTTLNGGYGSKTVVAGAGFLLNNEMDDFSVKPGVPNMYGALSTSGVVGTPGGTTIPTSVFQTIVNIIDFNLSTNDAVNKPKFHHQWKPDEIDVEKGFPDATADQLKAMGYKLVTRGQIGRTEVIKVLPGKKFEAVADGRGDDSAEGY